MLLDAWHDCELDVARSADLERHLEECPGCSSLSGARAVLSEVLTKNAPRYTAPASLRRKIEQSLPKPNRFAMGRRELPWREIALAASLAFFTMLGWNTWLMQTSRSVPQDVGNEIVSDHIRSLMANHLSDVASEDRHTVKPWFMGKLDYSPPVDDFATDGFKLIGGRLDYVGSKPVAALVYQHRAHMINVFVWPTRENDNVSSQPRWSLDHGYHVVRWAHSGMTFWAVSDVDPTELGRFTALLSSK
jgi:anti-sigma factor RsiW